MYSFLDINFDADYSKVFPTIRADYNSPMSSHDKAVLRSAKIELDRLCKQILKSNSNLRRKHFT